MTRVSIVVPNYNHEKYLGPRLESIFGQSYQDFEVLLLDDDSTDGSRSLLESAARHPSVSHLILNERRVGTFAQWQKAVLLARGEYVWIAESDDVADRSFLAEMVRILDAHAEVGVAYCQSALIDALGNTLSDNKRWTDDLDSELWSGSFQMPGIQALRKFLIFKNVIPNTSAVLFRKRLFSRVPADVTTFRYTGDWLAWSAMLERSDLYFTPRVLNQFRQHPTTTRVKRTFEQTAQYLGENYRVIDFIAKAAAVDRRALGRAHWVLAEKLYRDVGPSHLLEGPTVALTRRLSAFDPWLVARLLRFGVSTAKRGLLAQRGRVNGTFFRPR